MDYPIFVGEENIPLVHQDEEDYDERYDTPDTSRIDETSFIEHDTAGPTLTLCLRQKLKQDKSGSRSIYIQEKNQKQVILNCFFLILIMNGNPLPISALVNF